MKFWARRRSWNVEEEKRKALEEQQNIELGLLQVLKLLKF
jgi:hypothetical protein